MLQGLIDAAAHLVALLAYPGLLTVLAFGASIEIAWTRFVVRPAEWPELPRRRPGLAVVTVALCAMLAAVQLAAPLSPMPGEERSVVLAAAALLFATWAELALTVEYAAEPGLMLLVQVCWLLAVLGPAVQPESLRPQVLGNVQVPGLLPLKAASAMLYLLCLPALLRLWPMAPPQDRRTRPRLDAIRILSWFPYCGLFTTLFIPPSSDDVGGTLRFSARRLPSPPSLSPPA
ncbi:MAG TPA: hypothetical protein VEU76_09120 [Candidatus Udaeobacter sp.]|nr:hypothetical protein [Candidatus Udaeobacter sp.]